MRKQRLENKKQENGVIVYERGKENKREQL